MLSLMMATCKVNLPTVGRIRRGDILGAGLHYLTIANRVVRGAPYGVAEVRFLAVHEARPSTACGRLHI